MPPAPKKAKTSPEKSKVFSKAWQGNTLKTLGRGLVIVFLFTLVQTFVLRWVNPPMSAFMIWDWAVNGQELNLPLEWADCSGLSPNLARAILASEDQRFYEHFGIDWREVKRAMDEGFNGEGFRGASTVTMQVARNMFLWPGRSMVRKILEAYYTILLELFLPKNRILEIYLNIAEMGQGIYGAPEASKHYFGRSAARLTQDQAARLAIVLPSPKRYSPLRNTAYMSKRRRFVLKQMRYMQLVDWPS